MRDEDIKKYIDRLNNDEFGETIFIRHLNSFVDLARVWEKVPEIDDEIGIEIPSYQFFFIKNESEKYVGAVLDMNINLHWYILEEERKKGYLTKSLREAIIPFIFYDENDERNTQRITIEHGFDEVNYRNSKKVAESIGFKSINDDDSVFELNKHDFDWQHENLNERNGMISTTRIEELQKRLILSFRHLMKISDELMMSYNDDKNLKETAREVSYFKLKIEDIKWENESKYRTTAIK